MKKIFAILIAAAFMFAAISCANNTDNENDVENNIGNEQTVTPETPEEKVPETEIPEAEAPENTEPEVPELPEADINADGSEHKLNAVSYETFKEFIGYSMMPYDMKVDTEKNMVHAVAGYNGKVELSYFSFTAYSICFDIFFGIVFGITCCFGQMYGVMIAVSTKYHQNIRQIFIGLFYACARIHNQQKFFRFLQIQSLHFSF